MTILLAPGCRKSLLALGLQLEQKCPENLEESEAKPEPSAAIPESKLC